ncbi:major tail protein [Cytobacillus horneckiae]|uniref:major tail protein n=1 Tax=Cytobacillus horneckiae TaxID=549687 RepID=UPI0039A36BF8
MAENKVTFGLKNAHYAPITVVDGVITYGTPVKFPGAVELTLEPKGEQTDFFADDIIYYTASSNQGYDGTLTVAKITEKFRQEILGETLDETSKTLEENSNAKPNSFALMFEFDGDVKSIRHVLYNCSAARPTISGSTKTEATEPGTSELSFVASPREDGKVKTSTTAETPVATYDDWYKEVFGETPAA